MGLSLNVSLPAGSVQQFAGASAPAGWLECGGQAVSRTTYAALFLAIGTAFGAGDGSTTFNVPDMRGRVGVGRDDMGGTAANRVTTGNSGLDGVTIGAAGGSEVTTLLTAQMPSHNHGPGAGAALVGANSGSFTVSLSGGAGGAYSAGAAMSGVTGARGSGSAHPNIPPSIIINWVIKT